MDAEPVPESFCSFIPIPLCRPPAARLRVRGLTMLLGGETASPLPFCCAGCGCSPTAHSCILCCMFPETHFGVPRHPVPSYLLSVVSYLCKLFYCRLSKTGAALL